MDLSEKSEVFTFGNCCFTMILILVMAGIGLASAKSESGGSYFISFSRDLHRGMPFNVSVDILNASYPVHVSAKLQRSFRLYGKTFKTPLSTAGRDFVKGKAGHLELETPSKLQDSGSYVLNVVGSGGLNFEFEERVSFTYKTISVMIQTDKAMYKPGQKVLFRAFGVYPDLQLYKGKYQVTISDSNGNKLKRWRSLESKTGVVAGEYQLADQIVFGAWTITVQPEDQVEKETQTFTVAEYKLPRFEITVDLPPYAVSSDEMLSGTVKAKYTFGKPVKGMVELQAQIDTYSNPCGPPPEYVHQAFPIDGEAKFNIHSGDIKRLRSSLNGQTLHITAFVKEELTGVRLNASNSVDFYEYPYNIEILSSSPRTFAPKLSYSIIVKVSQPDGRPLGATNHPVSVYTCVKYEEVKDDQSMYGCREFSGSYGLPGQNLSLPASGILPVHMHIPENANVLEIKAHYREVSDTYNVKRKESSSNSYLQIRLVDVNIKAGSTATFSIEYTDDDVESMTYQIISRGTLINVGDIPVKEASPLLFRFPILHEMAPVTNIVIYYVRATGEIVADSISFSVKEVFDNEVSLDFSKNESEPNGKINIEISADPQSSVNLLAVDQSVLLLKSGNDVTTEKVLDELKSYGSGTTSGDFSPEVISIATSGRYARDIFRNAGMTIRTDAKYNIPRPRPRVMAFSRSAVPMMAMSMQMDEDAPMSFGGSGGLKSVERVRTNFPETWLWLNQTVGLDGKASIASTVPDTITSWVASAFAVNDVTGLGVAPTTAKLRVFQTFFVSLSMPTSVLRGEMVVIQASIFNYLSHDVNVVLTLPTSPDYDNVVVDAFGTVTKESKLQRVNVMVKSNEPHTVYFPVIPKTFGTIDIEVTAQTGTAADAVRRQLLVHPEGIRKEYNFPVYVDLMETVILTESIPLTLPPETVRGSEKARVKATGNLIGASLDNLENLLTLPTGCGEQNMMKFAPDVYIADYLTATNQMTPALNSKIIDFLELGLQRQLTYQRTDGSFSAFGERDEAGSMWLTAFVSQSFHQARRFILIDNSTLTRALNWMTGRQNKDGSFNEPGLVIDKKAQKSRSALTALVLLSILENRDLLEVPNSKKKFEDATQNAVKYLETMAPSLNDTFSLAVVSYALVKAGSIKADVPFNSLIEKAVMQGNLKYWTESTEVSPTTPTASTYYRAWEPPRVQAQPLDIQTTSYALMSYTARGNIRGGRHIIMWLTSQRNPHGGFSSTKDTVVALQALTDVAKRMSLSNLKMDLQIQGVNNERIEMSVTNRNALVLQSREFTNFPNEVVLQAKGYGVAYVEIDVFYNVNAEIGKPSFDVNVVLMDDTINKYRIMVCTKWLKEEDSSGMAVMEVAIASGFEPDMTSVGNVAGIKRIERRGRNVNVYFDQIGKTSTCFFLLATRTGMVSNNQASYVTVYDYYQPENQASIFYEPQSLKTASVCDVCTKCCPKESNDTKVTETKPLQHGHHDIFH